MRRLSPPGELLQVLIRFGSESGAFAHAACPVQRTLAAGGVAVELRQQPASALWTCTIGSFFIAGSRSAGVLKKEPRSLSARRASVVFHGSTTKRALRRPARLADLGCRATMHQGREIPPQGRRSSYQPKALAGLRPRRCKRKPAVSNPARLQPLEACWPSCPSQSDKSSIVAELDGTLGLATSYP